MKTTTILNTNFVKDETVFSCVTYEINDMLISLYNDFIKQAEKTISKIDKQLEIETDKDVIISLEAKKEAAEANKEEAKNNKKEAEADREDLKEIYNKNIECLIAKNIDHFGNSKENVRSVLRILGTVQNRKLSKYALNVTKINYASLYEALESIHINSKCNDVGQLSLTKEVKEAYKNASSTLENIIKCAFSLPFETELTEKTRIKLTKEDKKALHDCYVKGLKNNFKLEEDGSVSFVGREKTTLVKTKVNKKNNEKTVNYKGLETTLIDIVLRHYFINA